MIFAEELLGTLCCVARDRELAQEKAQASPQATPRFDARDRRVLVTGATGLLGRQVLTCFRDHGWTVMGLGHSRAKDSVVSCDLFVSEQIRRRFDEFRPTVVIHCAAERRPDILQGNEEIATRMNVDLARNVAELCRDFNSWLIFMSTNYVFDGKCAPYAEDALPCPLSVYGASKLSGERAVLNAHPQAAILRVPLLFGPVEYLGETTVTALLDIVKAESPKVDHWQERFPTSTEDLAKVMQAFSEQQLRRGRSNPAEFGGIFHWQANERQTKYTMASIIAEIAGTSCGHLIAVETAPAPGGAPRPQFERMNCHRLEKLLDIEGDPSKWRSDFRESLKKVLAPHLGQRAELKRSKTRLLVVEPSSRWPETLPSPRELPEEIIIQEAPLCPPSLVEEMEQKSRGRTPNRSSSPVHDDVAGCRISLRLPSINQEEQLIQQKFHRKRQSERSSSPSSPESNRWPVILVHEPEEEAAEGKRGRPYNRAPTPSQELVRRRVADPIIRTKDKESRSEARRTMRMRSTPLAKKGPRRSTALRYHSDPKGCSFAQR